MVTDESHYIQRKLYILNYAKQVGDVKKACRYFGIARSTYYAWKNQYKNGGIEGLARKKTGSVNHPKRTPKAVDVVTSNPLGQLLGDTFVYKRG